MLRVGYFSYSDETPPRYTGPLRVGFYGVYDRFDAEIAYKEGLKTLRKGLPLEMPEDYLPGMGKKAGLRDEQIAREISEATRLKKTMASEEAKDQSGIF